MIVEAFIEIPKGSRNKYEVDEKTGEIKLDRVLYSSVYWPVEYGFIKGTKGEDGDPLDIMIFSSSPTFPGCVVEAEVIGYLEMEDESGVDHKVLAVPTAKIDPRLGHIKDIGDVPEFWKTELKEFTEVYKRLEPEKWVKVRDFRSKKEAEELVEEARKRYG
ncbi:inorganic diphosphatase [Patescibacteria group bacterium]|nr:inorganic diphosphatase [Patescibacteria group bacterium]